MSDIRKLINMINETTVAGAVGGGPAVPLGATHKRMEEEVEESHAPEVIEYGNWENSALVTGEKTKSSRPRSAKVVKSVYGEAEAKPEAEDSKEKTEAKPRKGIRESLEDVEESGLQAYLGNKKYGKAGMDALRKAGREGASKEKMAKIRAKYDKLDEEGVGEAGFPGAPDVEMPPMEPSGDPNRDKLKQEYVNIHREIKSLVDVAYAGDQRAKARIKQLNARADQIKSILYPRQPPNQWQKDTYGYDDNWNIVKKGVAEGSLANIKMPDELFSSLKAFRKTKEGQPTQFQPSWFTETPTHYYVVLPVKSPGAYPDGKRYVVYSKGKEKKVQNYGMVYPGSDVPTEQSWKRLSWRSDTMTQSSGFWHSSEEAVKHIKNIAGGQGVTEGQWPESPWATNEKMLAALKSIPAPSMDDFVNKNKPVLDKFVKDMMGFYDKYSSNHALQKALDDIRNKMSTPGYDANSDDEYYYGLRYHLLGLPYEQYQSPRKARWNATIAKRQDTQGMAETSSVTDYNPKSQGGTRKELLAKYHKTKSPKDAEAARKAGATQRELKGVSEAKLDEEDLIVNPAAIKKLNGLISKAADRTDHEVQMARSDLIQAAKNAKMVYELVKNIPEEQGIEGWVQEKIIKAADYLNTVREYLESQHIENHGETQEQMACPKCGGPAFSEESIAEAKDACYHKVKSRYKVWPSAYASGALVKCRKVGAKNWGSKS